MSVTWTSRKCFISEDSKLSGCESCVCVCTHIENYGILRAIIEVVFWVDQMYRKNWSGTPVERLHATAKAAAAAWVAPQTQTHLPPLCSIALSVEASHWFQATVPNAHLVVSRYQKSMEEGKRVGLAALDWVPSLHPTFGLTHLHHRGLVHACKRWPAPHALSISRSLFPSSTVKHMIIFVSWRNCPHCVKSVTNSSVLRTRI